MARGKLELVFPFFSLIIIVPHKLCFLFSHYMSVEFLKSEQRLLKSIQKELAELLSQEEEEEEEFDSSDEL